MSRISAVSADCGDPSQETARQLVLMVPSAIVPEAMNGSINPLHPRYGEVAMTVVRPFAFDPRMLSR